VRLRRLIVASLAIALWGGALCCQAPDAFAQDEDEAELASRQKLAKEFTDPLTTLPQVFMSDTYTPANYGTDAQTNRAIVRAIIPRIPRFSLLPLVQLVRPTFSLVTVPTGKGSATRTEFGDMQLFDAFVLPWSPVEGLRAGVGPTFVFPTATHKLAGQGAWQVGPLFAALYKGTPWLLAGCLIQNPISFAYTSPNRQRVSTFVFQPLVLVALPDGWYVKSGDAALISGYLGKSDTFDQGIGDFALAYADQNAKDHAALVAAVKAGRIKALVEEE